MDLNRWWARDRAERFWMETTDRPDIGVDLNAPQHDEAGRRNWRYHLITEVGDGDVVFHYLKRERAITAWSWVVGSVVEDTVVWVAQGTSARGRGVRAYTRPGWRLGLQGPFALDPPLRLADITTRVSAVRAVVSSLQQQHGTLYFPFELSTRRPVRPLQGYVFKVPKRFVELWPELDGAVPRTGVVMARVPSPADISAPRGVGQNYVSAHEERAISGIVPFKVDPSVVDRGRRGHARTQNLIAGCLKDYGVSPLSPSPDDPQFDLAWAWRGQLHVCEVKSLTSRNEEQQLRLGLGQVLRYADLLERQGHRCVPVLAGERRPRNVGWKELCQRLGVVLLWPEVADEVLRKLFTYEPSERDSGFDPQARLTDLPPGASNDPG